MAALTIADLLLVSMTSRLDRIQAFFAYSEALAEEQEEIIEEIQEKKENESYENCNGK